jgi:5-methylthioadenosine/S-adenosylhomocysteine deaminase
MDAKTVLKMATRYGAKAIGLEKHIGSLEPGKQADVIIVDTDTPHLVPMYNSVSHLIYTAQGSDVRDVMVAGRILVRNKNLLTLDLEDILEKLTRFSRSILKK